MTNIFENIQNSQAREGVYAYTNTLRYSGGTYGSAIRSNIDSHYPSASGEAVANFNLSFKSTGVTLARYDSIKFAENLYYCNISQPESRACIVRVEVNASLFEFDDDGSRWGGKSGIYYKHLLLTKANESLRIVAKKHTRVGDYNRNGAYSIEDNTDEDKISNTSTTASTSFNIFNFTGISKTYFDIVANATGSYVQRQNQTYPLAEFGTDMLGDSTFNGDCASGIVAVNAEWLPVFSIKDRQSIINWLNGVDEEPTNPLSPKDYNAEVIPQDASFMLDDYTTIWRGFISGKTEPKFDIDWYCADVETLDVNTRRTVKIIIASDEYFNKPIWSGSYIADKCTINLGSLAYTNGWTDSNGNYSGDVFLYCMLYTSAGHSEVWKVRLKFKNDKTSSYGADIHEIWYGEYLDLGVIDFHVPTRTVEEEFYVYSASGLGDKFKIKYGARGKDDDYTHKEDNIDEGDYGDSKEPDIPISVLQATYLITNNMLTRIAQYVWGNTWHGFWANVTSNLMDCVVSLKSIPFLRSEGTAVSHFPLGSGYVDATGECTRIKPYKEFTLVNGYTVPYVYESFLDYSPFTQVILWLPYIGFMQLPADEVVNKSITIKYLVDFVNGDCKALVLVDGYTKWTADGNCAVDFPMVSNNRAVEMTNRTYKIAVDNGNFVSNVSSGAGQIASGNYIGGGLSLAGAQITGTAQQMYDSIPNWNYTTTANPMNYCDALCPQSIYLIIDSPDVQYPANYNHTMGKPCMLTLSIGSLNGYTECSNVDVSGFNATEVEREMIKNILESGFYV